MAKRVIACAALLALISVTAMAQRRGFRAFGGGEDGPFTVPVNVRYDGRFTFVRLKYTTAPGGYWYRGLPSWAHGYPVAEQNLMRIMNEVSGLDANVDDIKVLSLDDPEVFKYPVAYIIEVGWWEMTDAEAAALRAFMDKGGFVIVDDFKTRGWNRGMGGGGWDVFDANMQRVRPGARFFDMQATHPIFHSFFEINSLDNFPQAYVAGAPIFRGLFEDNNPSKRLQMMVNYNTDVSQYWEWSGQGLRPIDDTNEAYKLGVNYIIYGLTH